MWLLILLIIILLNRKTDGFVKSPSAALHFIFSHSDVLLVRLIPKDSCALQLELFTVPSNWWLFAKPSRLGTVICLINK